MPISLGLGLGLTAWRRAPVNAVPLDPAVVFIFRAVSPVSTRSNLNHLIAVSGAETVGLKVANAVNLNGQATGIAVNVTAAFSDRSEAGNAALSVPDYFLAGELNNSWYVDPTKTAAVTLSGLNPAKTYRLVAAGSRAVPSTDLTRVGEFAITAGTPAPSPMQLLNAANPAADSLAGHVIFTITPTAGGEVSFTLKRNAADGFAYLGGLHLQSLS